MVSASSSENHSMAMVRALTNPLFLINLFFGSDCAKTAQLGIIDLDKDPPKEIK